MLVHWSELTTSMRTGYSEFQFPRNFWQFSTVFLMLQRQPKSCLDFFFWTAWIYYSSLKHLKKPSLVIAQLFFCGSAYSSRTYLFLDVLTDFTLSRMSWNSSLDFVLQGQNLPCNFIQGGQWKQEQFKLRSIVCSKWIPCNPDKNKIQFSAAALPRV